MNKRKPSSSLEDLTWVARLADTTVDIGAKNTDVILTNPTSDSPKGVIWDFFAASFNTKTRQEVYDECLQFDYDGNAFYGTNDVESFVEDFNVESEDGLLEIVFVAYISEEEEDWYVSLRGARDLPLFRQFLREQSLNIQIVEDTTVLNDRLNDISYANNLLNVQLNTLIEQLKGFDGEKMLTNWRDCPNIPLGLELARIAKGWLIMERVDYKQVEFVHWLLHGKFLELWHFFYSNDIKNDTKNAYDLVARVTKLLESEYLRPKSAGAWPNPNYMKWKKQKEELRNELALVNKVSKGN